MTPLGPAFTRSRCRLCGDWVHYGEATSARKVRPSWRHGFVHTRPCYSEHLDRQRVLREERRSQKARRHDDTMDTLFEILSDR